MICNVCQNNEATVHLTQMLEGEIKKIDMCESCAQKQGVDEPGMPLIDLLVGLGPSSSETSEEDETTPSTKRLVCQVCGNSLADFKKTGRLGCSHCYEVFANQMDPMLRSMHKGIKHTGKAPKHFKDDRATRDQLEKLEKKLQKAIIEERYEDAAVLRDSIKQLSEQATPADEPSAHP
jgi:protein arginine kinase activator